jgi:5'(3')-deoxyribonucleotidase
LCLAIDMDEVLAGTLGKQLDCYNRRYGARVRPADLEGVELAEIVPSGHRQWVLEMMHEPGFFANIPPMAGALEAMERLCRRHRVYIVSAATETPGPFHDKMDWIAGHLPRFPTQRIVFCGEKSVLDVDYLVDDTPGHFAGMSGVGLLFDAPHNRPECRYHRVLGWGELETAIELHEDRRRTAN